MGALDEQESRALRNAAQSLIVKRQGFIQLTEEAFENGTVFRVGNYFMPLDMIRERIRLGIRPWWDDVPLEPDIGIPIVTCDYLAICRHKCECELTRDACGWKSRRSFISVY